MLNEDGFWGRFSISGKRFYTYIYIFFFIYQYIYINIYIYTCIYIYIHHIIIFPSSPAAITSSSGVAISFTSTGTFCASASALRVRPTAPSSSARASGSWHRRLLGNMGGTWMEMVGFCTCPPIFWRDNWGQLLMICDLLQGNCWILLFGARGN